MPFDPSLTPLLEHDDAPYAYIEPGEQIRPRDVPAACVITFFGDAVQRLGEHWDNRSWQTQSDVRDNLVAVAGSAALRVERWRAAQRRSGSIATATNSSDR